MPLRAKISFTERLSPRAFRTLYWSNSQSWSLADSRLLVIPSGIAEISASRSLKYPEGSL